ncbi:phosphatidylinositol mannoside acyltransferase [Modestobacter sp. VKM Ac-2985]|uniref:phosphatidylinositol mannoside acyltransferase n=1 Tax=Modestobacter sp. VKM Ac-2985 TaxID=3004139 RepID=UPI0022AB6DEB|nr:phosphatidylinositol mannoside acyltransferase [Modestobacter sp. VKM Ac-2985]MCZ2837436.1 phosphatidylinositol mannoside acyltransferase [Modestobacter sp. VKM Ac-2985]
MSRRADLLARLTDAGYAAGWRAVRLLPEPAARAGAAAGGALAVRRGGRGARQLRANLDVVTGGGLDDRALDDLTRRAMQSYARYWQEAFRLPTLSSERILAGSELRGREHLEAARAQGRGIVLALPHSGNWDAAGVWLIAWLGGPFLTVAERLRPESLYRRFVAFRERLGMRVVPLTGGERPSSAVLREWLADGGTACLLMDRDLSGSGVPVTFFGRRTTMPGGPALVAAQTGATLLPAVCQFDGAGWQFVVHPPVPLDGPGRLRDRVTSATQQVADAFATTIAERPEDWHVLGRVWPEVGPMGRAPASPAVTTPAAEVG